MNDAIGEAAGKVWGYLNERREATTPVLVKQIGLPRDVAQRAVGWLAREDKISIDNTNGVERLRLK